MEIRVDHLTRVEGHGNILASIKDGRVQKALFEVVEANRVATAVAIAGAATTGRPYW